MERQHRVALLIAAAVFGAFCAVAFLAFKEALSEGNTLKLIVAGFALVLNGLMLLAGFQRLQRP